MSERINIPFTGEHFAAWCLSMLGQPYWYGTTVRKCTNDLLNRKARQYPTHYGSGRMSRYRQDIAAKKVCADCVGGCKGYAWSDGGVGVLESIGTNASFPSKYASHDCPDKSANGMFRYAKSKGMDWGEIDSIPEIVGLAVHTPGHVGYYVGNGYVVEWRGFSYGCVKTKLGERNWKFWYKLPFIQYDGASVTNPTDDEPSADAPADGGAASKAKRTLKKGSSGVDVKALQETLLNLGYTLPRCGADGEFGTETEAAVSVYQKDNNLEVDGIVGSKTWAALENSLAGVGVPQAQKPADESPEGAQEDGEAPEGNGAQQFEPADVVLDFGNRTLRYRESRGMQEGDDVRAVQMALTELGYKPGKIDGVYGPNTMKAVLAFQENAGIAADGIVGPDTRKALTAALAGMNAEAAPSNISSPVAIRIQMTRDENIAVYGAAEVSLDIEEYLRGVVPSEMYESADMEALKAQAICARTYACKRRGSLLSDTTRHQSFHADKIGRNPRSDEAIAATKGMVLTYKGEVINCFYSASNKGETKRSGDVWSTHYPYYVSKPDEWDETAREERTITTFGHGVGMSQHGAMWAARNGVKCDKILAFYYEGAVISGNYGNQ